MYPKGRVRYPTMRAVKRKPVKKHTKKHGKKAKTAKKVKGKGLSAFDIMKHAANIGSDMFHLVRHDMKHGVGTPEQTFATLDKIRAARERGGGYLGMGDGPVAAITKLAPLIKLGLLL